MSQTQCSHSQLVIHTLSDVGKSQVAWFLSLSNFLHINVDSVVVQDTEYSADMLLLKHILHNYAHVLEFQYANHTRADHMSYYFSPEPHARDIEMKKEAEGLIDHLCKATTRVYFKHRQKANNATDALLLQQFVDSEARSNILYESTGSNSAIGWLLNVAKAARNLGFRVSLIFSEVTDEKILVSRAVTRALKSTDGRLPCPEDIKKLNNEAQINFNKVLETFLACSEDCIFTSITKINNDKAQAPKIVKTWTK